MQKRTPPALRTPEEARIPSKTEAPALKMLAYWRLQLQLALLHEVFGTSEVSVQCAASLCLCSVGP